MRILMVFISILASSTSVMAMNKKHVAFDTPPQKKTDALHNAKEPTQSTSAPPRTEQSLVCRMMNAHYYFNYVERHNHDWPSPTQQHLNLNNAVTTLSTYAQQMLDEQNPYAPYASPKLTNTQKSVIVGEVRTAMAMIAFFKKNHVEDDLVKKLLIFVDNNALHDSTPTISPFLLMAIDEVQKNTSKPQPTTTTIIPTTTKRSINGTPKNHGYYD